MRVEHSTESKGRFVWCDMDKPLWAAPKLKPPALPGDTYFIGFPARHPLAGIISLDELITAWMLRANSTAPATSMSKAARA